MDLELVSTVVTGTTLLDHVQAWSTLAAAIVGLLVFISVAAALNSANAAKKQLRLQTGPYLRVDVGLPNIAPAEQFTPPKTYYVRENPDVLGDDTAETVTVSMWVQNLQPHSLGVAVGVQIVLAFVPEGVEDQTSQQIVGRLPYITYGNPVQINLLSVPSDWHFSVYVASVKYWDLYDERHYYIEKGRGSVAAFGRFECHYDGTTFASLPISWPQGSDIIYAE